MPIYTVIVCETVYHRAKVEAASMEEAREAAIEAVIEGGDNVEFVSVENRETYDVEEV